MTNRFSPDISPKELAKRWGVTIQTLNQWRWNSRGPEYTKIGRKIWYSMEAVRALEEKMGRRNTAEKR